LFVLGELLPDLFPAGGFPLVEGFAVGVVDGFVGTAGGVVGAGGVLVGAVDEFAEGDGDEGCDDEPDGEDGDGDEDTDDEDAGDFEDHGERSGVRG
jgi:hypothetical protein